MSWTTEEQRQLFRKKRTEEQQARTQTLESAKPKEPLEQYKVRELKEFLAGYKCVVGGTRQTLLTRLRTAISELGVTGRHPIRSQIHKYKIMELKQYLQARNVSTKGKNRN